MGGAGIRLAGCPACLVVVCGWGCLKDRRCARETSLGWRVAVLVQVVSRFLSVVAVCVVAGVSCCRVVPLVAVLVFVFREVVSVPAGVALGGSVFRFAPVILGQGLWPVPLRLLFRC